MLDVDFEIYSADNIWMLIWVLSNADSSNILIVMFISLSGYRRNLYARISNDPSELLQTEYFLCIQKKITKMPI